MTKPDHLVRPRPRPALLTILALAALCAAGCKEGGSPRQTTSAPTPTNAGAKRIVSLAPHLTEIVFALGQGHRVVGVSSFSKYPPQASRLPQCGGPMNTNLEKVLSLRPDLVLIHGKYRTVAQLCERNHIPLLRTSPNDLASLYDAIDTLGQGLGCPDEARRLIAGMKADIDRVRAAVKGRPVPKVFLSFSTAGERTQSLATANGQSVLSKMLEVAGGENIFAETNVTYPKIGPSEFLRRQPDVIIQLCGETISDEQQARMIGQWKRLGATPATINDRIYLVTEDFAMIPGPRVPLLAKRLAELLHPDLKGKLD